MLDEYKDLYRLNANQIKGWETIDKSELCRLCLANEDNTLLYNQYLSAVICRYWNLISKFYAQSKNLAEPTDCYDWLIHSILYAFKHRQWENPDSPMYNDPKAPDKIINRCMKSSRLIHYQFYNRKKRRKEYNLVSIEELQSNLNSDDINIEDESANIDTSDLDVSFYISQIFREKEYFLAFILDIICTDDVFTVIEDSVEFNIKKLAKYFKSIDDVYLRDFSKRYDIEYSDVYQAAILAKNVPESKLKYKIEDTLLRLKHSSLIRDILGDEYVN